MDDLTVYEAMIAYTWGIRFNPILDAYLCAKCDYCFGSITILL